MPLKVNVIRDRATLAREVEDERIENLYTLRLMNTDEQPHSYRVTAEGIESLMLVGDANIELAGASTKSVMLSVRIKNDATGKGSHPFIFDVVDTKNADVRLREKAVFIVP
jgi:polyferredoxin